MTSDPISLMPLVYDELRRIAAGYIGRERPGQTLQATALVNEAFVRLASEKARPFANRTHFLAIAALSMRQILVQRARARKAAKRHPGRSRHQCPARPGAKGRQAWRRAAARNARRASRCR